MGYDDGDNNGQPSLQLLNTTMVDIEQHKTCMCKCRTKKEVGIIKIKVANYAYLQVKSISRFSFNMSIFCVSFCHSSTVEVLNTIMMQTNVRAFVKTTTLVSVARRVRKIDFGTMKLASVPAKKCSSVAVDSFLI